MQVSNSTAEKQDFQENVFNVGAATPAGTTLSQHLGSAFIADGGLSQGVKP